uniref:Centrosomin N-terminal motif 1 domain-containing protein n=1 Tax=Labrus bergylta TaxID=56723 RepID=A0A3Q3G0F8_9LABR
IFLCRANHLNDLKKENFSLKLRIYFLEEKIQQKFEESGDDVHKRVSRERSASSNLHENDFKNKNVCMKRFCRYLL